jgi:protein-S-isoprenylcysteine O-methyltransferase Ste14
MERISSPLHLLGSRGIPTFLFAMLALLALDAATRSTTAAVLMFHLLGAVLWIMFAVLVATRPAPLRRGGHLVGVVVALAAQFSFLLVGLAANTSRDDALLVVADVLLLVGLVVAIASVAVLGRCFGVLPDVRGLVTRGPYRIVRHPLYLGELMALLGLALCAAGPALALAAWLACVGLQIVRTRYEEQALLAEFPEYADYAARTRRLIPGLV